MPRGYPLSAAELANILCLARTDMSDAAIARRMGRHSATITRILRDHHVAPTSAVASAAHREGGAASPNAVIALTPNSMEASLIQRGMRPEIAIITARAYAARRA